MIQELCTIGSKTYDSVRNHLSISWSVVYV